jgi:ATP phosphoribosyltransferase
MLLNVGVPKGSLQEGTLRLLAKAGYTVETASRSYQVQFDDPELSGMLTRAQEIPRYVASGALDAGITGRDWVRECGVDVREVDELPYSKNSLSPIRWVVAVPEESEITELPDLAGKVVATELVAVTQQFFSEKGIDVKVEFSWGATEVKPPHLADAIVELTETGASLRANRLREIAVVIQSTTVMIANTTSWTDPEKRKKIENVVLLLKGAIEAEKKVGLKMNVPSQNLDRVLDVLPALKNPTISNLTEDGWCAVESVVEESVVRRIVPELKDAGAEGIIEFPLNKVIP